LFAGKKKLGWLKLGMSCAILEALFTGLEKRAFTIRDIVIPVFPRPKALSDLVSANPSIQTGVF